MQVQVCIKAIFNRTFILYCRGILNAIIIFVTLVLSLYVSLLIVLWFILLYIDLSYILWISWTKINTIQYNNLHISLPKLLQHLLNFLQMWDQQELDHIHKKKGLRFHALTVENIEISLVGCYIGSLLHPRRPQS
jgi:hypothetical protein